MAPKKETSPAPRSSSKTPVARTTPTSSSAAGTARPPSRGTTAAPTSSTAPRQTTSSRDSSSSRERTSRDPAPRTSAPAARTTSSSPAPAPRTSSSSPAPAPRTTSSSPAPDRGRTSTSSSPARRAGTQSDGTSSPGSGTHGRPPSQASSRSHTSSDNSAGSVNSSSSGETFIRYITSEASNAGESNPATDFVLCIDGTGNDMLNEDDVKNTNIAKITDLIEYGKNLKTKRLTVVAYQQGLGNKGNKGTSSKNDDSKAAGWAERLNASFDKMDASFDKLFPSAGTIMKLVAINYAYISMSVVPSKDRTFIFGFSRGAYVSQITAALVADLGIFSNQLYLETMSTEDYPKVISKIVEAWVKHGCTGTMTQPFQKALGKYAACLVPSKIQFLGLFDMVASVGAADLGVPGASNLQSSTFRGAESVYNRPNIVNAYHAVAISEHRNQFKPVLWTRGTATNSQVWFPGYHTSIGGGTKTVGIMVYYITLVWMLSKCTDLHSVIDDRLLEKLIIADANQASKMEGKQIPDSKKGIWAQPGMGDHIRTELGAADIDKVHRICDPMFWALRCSPVQPDVHGTAQKPIQTKAMLAAKKMDKPNSFEQSFYDKMVAVGPGQAATSQSPPKQDGRSKVTILDSKSTKKH